MDKLLVTPATQEKNVSMCIRQLFTDFKQIRIPAYQRAYSWEHKQRSQFLDDLLEQNEKQYYLGQLLFEKEGNTYYVIDGQQRLTTIVIFLSALASILTSREEIPLHLYETYLTDVFKTIDADQVTFKRVTQKHLVSKIDTTETISERRIIEAFMHFSFELNKYDVASLKQIQATLENSEVSPFFIFNKIQATQVFEYQNNRGKELSRFEIIKAYLMHQVYIQCSDTDQANNDIADIQSVVATTYRHIESVEGYFSENELLDNYCNLFFNIDGDFDSIKKQLGTANNKAKWIKEFFDNLVDLTQSAKMIVQNKNRAEISNLFFVGKEANWKLVLLTLFYKGDVSGPSYQKILKLLEILCFKLKLGDFRSDALPRFAKKYFNQTDHYSINDLHQEIQKATVEGFNWYWNQEHKFENIIENYFDNQNYHYDRDVLKIVLWQYENNQRVKNRSGALLDKELFDSYTIEHISPQNPKIEANTEEFKKEYLHKAGNLALLTLSQNSKFGNKSFAEKWGLFQDTALSSYTEIREKSQWTESEIDARHKNISSFVKHYFSIPTDSIALPSEP